MLAHPTYSYLRAKESGRARTKPGYELKPFVSVDQFLRDTLTRHTEGVNYTRPQA